MVLKQRNEKLGPIYHTHFTHRKKKILGIRTRNNVTATVIFLNVRSYGCGGHAFEIVRDACSNRHTVTTATGHSAPTSSRRESMLWRGHFTLTPRREAVGGRRREGPISP